MTALRYSREVWLPAAPEEVFAYSTSLRGFCSQFPFKVKWHAGPDCWACDDVLDFSYRVAGVWMRHRAQVIEFRHGERFVDEMTQGLYKHFRHTHRFDPERQGTRVRDEVEFSLGYGRLVDRLIGLPTLDSTFRKRHAALRAHFAPVAKEETP